MLERPGQREGPSAKQNENHWLAGGHDFLEQSCWRPGSPRFDREAASPVISPASSPSAKNHDGRFPATSDSSSQVFVTPAGDANTPNVKQMLLADMSGERGVERDYVLGPASPPTIPASRRIIREWPDESNVLNPPANGSMAR